MLIYETDTQYILEHENIRIIAEKKDCPDDYEAYLLAELEKAQQSTQTLPFAFEGKVYEMQDEPRLTEKSKWMLIRQKRNQLLAESDWTQMLDVPLDDADREAWRQYRQALRDIPQRFERADDVVWPSKPEK